MIISRTKAGKICRVSVVAVEDISFVGGQIFWGCLQSRSLWTAIAPAVCLLIIASDFLPCSFSQLYTYQLCHSVGWNQSAAFQQCSEMLSVTPLFLFWHVKFFSLQSFFLPLNSGTWGIGWYRHKIVFLFFLCNCSVFFFLFLFLFFRPPPHCVAKNVLSRL